MSEKVKQQDRVSYAFGRKLSDNNYGSFDVLVSYSTDVKNSEDIETALARCEKFVERSVLKKIEKLGKK
jgi:hypothetical protein